MERILITGGAGFAGHHLVEHLLKNTDWDIVIIDKLTYASTGFDRLRDIKAYNDKRVHTFAAAIDNPIDSYLEKEMGQFDYIVHMAAETHVDRSISDPLPFIQSNILGTYYVLEFARRQKNLKKMIQFSTDEVYGPAPEGVAYKEWDRLNAANPYAASKAGAEQLALAWANTYKVPILITNTMNIYGERQHPEKFIPLVIRKVLSGEPVFIHGTPDRKKAGSRFYIHARNVASAVLFLLNKEDISLRDKWHIVGEKEIDNLSLAQFIANVLGKRLIYEIVDFHSCRPGHDLRYALDGSKLSEAGWKHPLNFETSLTRTIKWIIDPVNSKWLDF